MSNLLVKECSYFKKNTKQLSSLNTIYYPKILKINILLDKSISKKDKIYEKNKYLNMSTNNGDLFFYELFRR